MKLRAKLTVTLLTVSLASAATVGGIAYWLLMRDFRQTVLEQAFLHFQEDVQRYIRVYGSWEAGVRSEPFPLFAERTHRNQWLAPEPPLGELSLNRRGRPPFLFLLLDPDGTVIKAGADYPLGMSAPPSLLKQARAIYVNGRIHALAVPLGAPNLSPQDHDYLSAMRKALITGFLVAGTLAILLGLWLGRRAVASLDELTRATHTMRRDGELQQPVPVRSKDEIGELASAFNNMSNKLTDAHRELKELSIRDPLTQLYNRRHFNEQSERLYQQSRRYGHALTLMVGDLDHFKKINDNLSHGVGDEVLRRIGAILTSHSRNSDVVSRHGGEEFVIALPETSIEQASRHCEKLRQAIESHPWEKIHPSLSVTMSMGLSDNLDAGSVADMLHEADTRLYEAKEAGRNRIEPALERLSA